MSLDYSSIVDSVQNAGHHAEFYAAVNSFGKCLLLATDYDPEEGYEGVSLWVIKRFECWFLRLADGSMFRFNDPASLESCVLQFLADPDILGYCLRVPPESQSSFDLTKVSREEMDYFFPGSFMIRLQRLRPEDDVQKPPRPQETPPIGVRGEIVARLQHSLCLVVPETWKNPQHNLSLGVIAGDDFRVLLYAEEVTEIHYLGLMLTGSDEAVKVAHEIILILQVPALVDYKSCGMYQYEKVLALYSQWSECWNRIHAEEKAREQRE